MKLPRVSKPFVAMTSICRYLWQILDLAELDTFLAGGLWCARLDTFNDALEGTLPDTNPIGLLRKSLTSVCRRRASPAADAHGVGWTKKSTPASAHPCLRSDSCGSVMQFWKSTHRQP